GRRGGPVPLARARQPAHRRAGRDRQDPRRIGDGQSLTMGTAMPMLETLPQDAPIGEVMKVIDRDGAVILEGMLPSAELDALVAELSPFLAATKVGRESFSGFKTTRTGALPARSPKVRTALTDRRILAVCDAVLL